MKPSSRAILIFNAQRDRPIDRKAVRTVVTAVLDAAHLDAEVAVHFISSRRSAALNERHLGHAGPTDILTFDHGSTPLRLCGELFICVGEAVRQAADFKVAWQVELLRYVIHGLLHLRGYDDLDPVRRRVMKREEDRLVRRCVPVSGIPPGLAPPAAGRKERQRRSNSGP